jgi:hypothetical protein
MLTLVTQRQHVLEIYSARGLTFAVNTHNPNSKLLVFYPNLAKYLEANAPSWTDEQRQTVADRLDRLLNCGRDLIETAAQMVNTASCPVLKEALMQVYGSLPVRLVEPINLPQFGLLKDIVIAHGSSDARFRCSQKA